MDGHVRLGFPATKIGDGEADAFRQARYFRYSRGLYQVLLGALHVAECAETKGAAEGLMAYAATMEDGRVASWNYAIDCDSITQSVLERQQAHHAPPVNEISIGFELAGYSAQDDAGWSDPYSTALLERAAGLFARVCVRNGIPIAKRTDEELVDLQIAAKGLASRKAPDEEWAALRARLGGIATHAQIGRAFKLPPAKQHHDPGAAFPFDQFLVRVAEIAASPAA